MNPSLAFDNNLATLAATQYSNNPWISFRLDKVYDDVAQVQLYSRTEDVNLVQGYTVSVSPTSGYNQGTQCGSNLGITSTVVSINVPCPPVSGTRYVTVWRTGNNVVIQLAEIRVMRGESCLHSPCA